MATEVSERKREEIRVLADAWHKALLHVIDESQKRAGEAQTSP
jgi:hypothetical protein